MNMDAAPSLCCGRNCGSWLVSKVCTRVGGAEASVAESATLTSRLLLKCSGLVEADKGDTAPEAGLRLEHNKGLRALWELELAGLSLVSPEESFPLCWKLTLRSKFSSSYSVVEHVLDAKGVAKSTLGPAGVALPIPPSEIGPSWPVSPGVCHEWCLGNFGVRRGEATGNSGMDMCTPSLWVLRAALRLHSTSSSASPPSDVWAKPEVCTSRLTGVCVHIASQESRVAIAGEAW